MSRLALILLTVVMGCGPAAQGQITNTVMTTNDAFVCTGSTNYQDGADLTGLNFGAAGTLVVAPPASPKGEFQGLVQFELSSDVPLFNSAYGSNHWSITAISLELASNYGTAGVQPNNSLFPVVSGGQFVIEWLADNDWVEGTGTPSMPTTDGVTYDSLPTLLAQPHEPLCTNLYSPPGNNVRLVWPLPLNNHLLTNAIGGGPVTFRFYAADDQVAYLFNSYNFGRGNEPFIQVVAMPLLSLVSGGFTNGSFHLDGIGLGNSTYHIQASTNLSGTNWLTIGTVSANDAGVIQFTDTNAAFQTQRFYRLSP